MRMLPHFRTLLLLCCFTAVSCILVALLSAFTLQNNSTEIINNKAISKRSCREKWPDLELYLTSPVNADGEYEYSEWFLPSLTVFWPTSQQLKLLIVTDIESEKALNFTKWAENLANKSIAGVQVRSVLTKRAFPCSGWDKSQWLKMWADNFTNATHVGFVDTDTVFVTRITRDDLFVDNKPIVRPLYGKPKSAWNGNWYKVPQWTMKYTGFKEPFSCMSYFPIVVKTAHLKFVRERIRTHMGKRTFDEAFANFLRKGNYPYSEFNLICTVLWWQFRDEYFWVINENEVGYKGVARVGQVANLAEAQITDEMLERTRPHLAVHWTYISTARKPLALRNALRKGYCYSLAEKQRRPKYCASFNNRTAKVNGLEFTFEFNNFSNRKFAFEAHLLRIQMNEQCPHDDKILSEILHKFY